MCAERVRRALPLARRPATPDWTPRPSLPSDLEADVAIVGAGFTGLWTAHYLAEADPTLRIVVLEAETAGFGASGRNGGWCSALFPASLDTLARLPGRARPRPWPSTARCARPSTRWAGSPTEGIDAHLAKGGTIALARTGPQWRRARAEVADARAQGLRDDLRAPRRGRDRVPAAGTRVRGATYTPDCAAIHPARLVRGLADAVERRGVRILEHTRVARDRARPRRDGRRHACAPRWSCGRPRATPPAWPGSVARWCRSTRWSSPPSRCPRATWEEIGLARRETFTDHRHLIIYGQRTADDRLVFGGRGAPYHFGSRIRPEFDRDERVFAQLHATLVDLFPVLGPAPGSPTPGAARSASPATGARRSGWTARPAWPGPAGTSATASAPPTSPAGPCATSCSAATPS